MPTLTKKNATLTQLVAEVNKKAEAVVDKKGKPTRTTKIAFGVEDAEAKPTKVRRNRKAVVVVEPPAKPKNPIQIRHQRAGIQPAGKYALVGTDTVTDCGRIVVKQMTRANLGNLTGKTVVACPHCLQGGHRDRAFQIVRGQIKLLPIED